MGTRTRWLAGALVRASGWKIEGELQVPRRCVLLCAPHTSMWDLWITVLFGSALGVRLHWLGKHTLFWWPNRLLLTAMGGIPINRHGGQDAVRQVAARFHEGHELVLAISPEGAKRHREHWRSGFWYIAREAEVPIVIASLDWRGRVCRVSAPFLPTTIEADMDHIRATLEGVMPKHPELFGPIRLRSELEEAAPTARRAQP